MLKSLLLALPLLIALPAFAQDAAPKADAKADAKPGAIVVTMLDGLDGAAKGTAQVNTEGKTTMLRVELSGMTPGWHGIHFHAKGLCNAGDKFTSAGPHASFKEHEHGAHNPEGMHEGDLPNIWVGADGTGKAEFFTPYIDQNQMLDADGTSLIVHATADDLKSDPSGNSGDRIACGVISKPAQ